MPFDLTSENEEALEVCLRQGALRELARIGPATGRVRRMWMRKPLVDAFYGKGEAEPTHWAAAQVQAFIQRYIRYDWMIIATQTSRLSTKPDFKLTQGGGLPIFEIRFRITPHKPDNLRLFGRFLATDCFIVTSIGEKGIDEKGRQVSIDVKKERERCQTLFKTYDFSSLIPNEEESLTKFRRAR